MKMLRSLKDLVGYTVHALDGDIGGVDDFYFDEKSWKVRYMVAQLGLWIEGRKVIVAPVAFMQPHWKEQAFPVALTKEMIRSSPVIDTSRGVARAEEEELYRHYGWDVYGSGEAIMGTNEVKREGFPVEETREGGEPIEKITHDPNLKQASALWDCRIHAIDGDIGHVDDLIIDDERWQIHNLVISTRTLLPGKKVLLTPQEIRKIEWEERKVFIDVNKKDLVNRPPFDASEPANYVSEEIAYDFHGRRVEQ